MIGGRGARLSAFALVVMTLEVAPQAHAESRRALLVGINKYAPAGGGRVRSTRTGGRDPAAFVDLHGAVNDVEAVRAVLIARFGFRPEDVHLLVNATATRDRILSEIRRWLIDGAAPGDVRLFYYAGHGSQMRNSRSPEPDRLDETIVPADANAGAADIRDKEIARLFGEALDRHVLLTVGFDSCHSGSISRGPLRPMRVRAIAPDPRDVMDPSTPPSLESRGAVVLAAAQSHEVATETVDEDGIDHGLFTWALVKTLRTSPPTASAERLLASMRGLMHSIDPGQDPDLSAPAARRQAPVLGVQGVADGRTMVALRTANGDGTYTVEGGIAAGVYRNCELREIDGAATLRIVETDGVAMSKAVLVSGDRDSIAPGTLFEIARWAPPDRPALRLWLGGGGLDADTIARQTGALGALAADRTVTWVRAPIASDGFTAATAVVEWTGASWSVQVGGVTVASARDVAAVVAAVPPDAEGRRSVFVNLPLANEIRKQLNVGTGTDADAIELLPSAAGADYLLVGRMGPAGVEYAWARPSVNPASTATSLPPVTGWVAAGPQNAAQAAQALRRQALRLAVIRSWLELESPPGARGIPYHLELRNAVTGELQHLGTVRNGDTYGLVLKLDRSIATRRTSPQYVYAFLVDSSGASVLLYPTADAGGGGENLAPQRDETGQLPDEIPLGPPSLFKVSPPLGTDTYVLLTTATPLPDPDVLQGDGVRAREAARGITDPLALLLAHVTAGRRGGTPTTPTDWTIERISIESVPADREQPVDHR